MTPKDVIYWTDKAYSRPNIVNASTDTQAYWENTKEACIVAFAPTQTWKDIKTDLFSVYKGGIHMGFLMAAESIRREVESRVKASPNKKVIFCGHSLGGALAILMTAAGIPGKEIRCYTTGAPRPFRGPFARAVSKHQGKAITLYKMPGDVIPYLPPWGDPVGKEIDLGAWTWKDRLGLNLRHHLPQYYREHDKIPEVIK